MNYQSYVKQVVEHFAPYKEKWNYEDACVLQGAYMLYEVTGEEMYKNLILNYLHDFISPEGKIKGYEISEYNIDSIAPGRLLFPAMEWEPEESRYPIALATIRRQLETHPRTAEGNFWHKKIYPWQVWLDGLYMAQPFYAAYDTLMGDKGCYRDILSQFENVRRRLFVEDKGLYIHAYDEKRAQPWADKESGHSPNFWLRAIGWHLVALIETYDEIAETIFEVKEAFVPLFREAVDGILRYQDEETGLFYDLVDLPELEGNYLETSGSAMIAYAILKGCRLGLLDPAVYGPIGRRIMQSLHDLRLKEQDGRFRLEGMVEVSGLGPGEARDGSTDYYLSEPIVADDHKGTGAFMMAYAELLRQEGAV